MATGPDCSLRDAATCRTINSIFIDDAFVARARRFADGVPNAPEHEETLRNEALTRFEGPPDDAVTLMDGALVSGSAGGNSVRRGAPY